MRHNLLAAPALALLLTLAACSGGSGSGPSSESAAARERLPDLSDQVESVEGEDPRRYFVANLKALNAVDLDDNGLWDDVEAAAKADPVLAPLDPQVLSLGIRAVQAPLVLMSKQEALAQDPTLYARFLECLFARSEAGTLGGDGTPEQVTFRLEAALLTSKERVLAKTYANFFYGGESLSLANDGEASCDA